MIGNSLPKLYVIADRATLVRHAMPLAVFAREMRDAGVHLLQWRDKVSGPEGVLEGARVLRETYAGADAVRLVMNDRADLAALAAWTALHLGQGDLAAEDARLLLGEHAWIGLSTHDDEQVRAADASAADYVAIGPVFATGTKLDAEPVVGLEGVRRARALTAKPLVAIGGITRANARSVIAAGADAVAVIGALFAAGETPGEIARDFLRILG